MIKVLFLTHCLNLGLTVCCGSQAHSLIVPIQQGEVAVGFSPDHVITITQCVCLFQVLFCADLKKFQNLKEMSLPKKPQKEGTGGAEMRAACRKTKMKKEENDPGKIMKTKSAKKAKMSV